MRLEDILQEYSAETGLSGLALDKNGICHLTINGKYVIAVEKSLDGHGFYLYSVTGSIPENKEKEYSMMTLTGNLFGKETGRASIGFYPPTKSLVLFEYLDERLDDTTSFKRKLSDFVGYLAYWLVKVRQPAHVPELEEISIQKHISGLQAHGNMKIFFA